MTARRHGYRPQRAAAWPRDARVAWRGWLSAGRARAGAALAGLAADKAEEVELAEGALRSGKTPYPVADFPAQGLARAWVELAKTFIATTGTARRAQIARPLEQLSIALDDILDEAGLAAAERGRVMLGERDG